METIQISSPAKFKLSLKRWSKQAGMNVSEFVRAACRYYADKVLPNIKRDLKL